MIPLVSIYCYTSIPQLEVASWNPGCVMSSGVLNRTPISHYSRMGWVSFSFTDKGVFSVRHDFPHEAFERSQNR